MFCKHGADPANVGQLALSKEVCVVLGGSAITNAKAQHVFEILRGDLPLHNTIAGMSK